MADLRSEAIQMIDDELAMMIGYIARQDAEIDMLLHAALEGLQGRASDAVVPIMTGPKMKALRRMLMTWGPDVELRKDAIRVLDRIHPVRDLRNMAVHGRWISDAGVAGYVINTVDHRAHGIRWDPSDFEECHAKLNLCRVWAGALWTVVRGEPADPGTHLRAQLRGEFIWPAHNARMIYTDPELEARWG